MLGWLLLVSSAGGVDALMNIEGGYQDSQFEGGVDQIPRAMANDLGESVVLDAPVSVGDAAAAIGWRSSPTRPR